MNKFDISNGDNLPEKQEFFSADDTILHFNKTIYPQIESQFHPKKQKLKKSLIKLFVWEKKIFLKLINIKDFQWK